MMFAMSKFAASLLVATLLCSAADLSTKKALNLATVKAMVAAAEAEEQKAKCAGNHLRGGRKR